MNSKDILAKLLASEDITVERKQATTASFDIVNRVLTLPNWKDLDVDIEDLFIFHEVAHALYTPMDALEEVKTGSLKNIINVLEDNRIERYIKIKYPATRSIFARAYKKLFDDEFFGTRDVSELNILDKINLFSKVGFYSGVEFEDDEQELFDEVNSCNTYNEVFALAKRIEEDYKERQEKQKEESEAEFSYGSDEDETEDELLECELEYDEELISETYEAERQNAEGFADTDKIFQFPLREAKNIANNAMTSYETILQQHSDNFYDSDVMKLHDEFIESSKHVVQSMVAMFQQRKSAETFRRTAVSKSGSINSATLFKHKISDNIFKTISTVKEGQNHGLFFLLDWSQSMNGVMDDTVDQLIQLVMFCRKTNIPFKVYAFSDWALDGVENYNVENVNYFCKLFEFFSSGMSNAQFDRMCLLLRKWQTLGREYKLHATPLNEALIASIPLVDEMRDKYKISKMNLVVLTDGESAAQVQLGGINKGIVGHKIVFSDSRNSQSFSVNYTYRFENELYRKLLGHYKGAMKVEVSVFQVVPANTKEISRLIPVYMMDSIEDKLKQMRSNGFVRLEYPFLDNLFLVNSKKLSVEGEELVVDQKASTASLVRAFSRSVSSNKINRIVLTKFIDQIS